MKTILLFVLCFAMYAIHSQIQETQIQETESIVFWNVENYFDPFRDTLIADADFTPMGAQHWTWKKFVKKRNALAKTLVALGVSPSSFQPPAIIGLCEIENYLVLKQLITETPLAPLQYGIIHRNSSDPRGIDVAMLYRKSAFEPLKSTYYALHNPVDSQRIATRDILYVKGLFTSALDAEQKSDTLHLFVNHWPSKRGGAIASAPRRLAASATLRRVVDSVLEAQPQARLLIMGDFNDTPESEAIAQLLYSADSLHTLHNISAGPSYKYQGRWSCIDQFMVSRALRQDVTDVSVARFGFLLEQDKTHLGEKPYRTFLGPRYQGGISDHLPIRVKIATFACYGHQGDGKKGNRQDTAYEPVLCR